MQTLLQAIDFGISDIRSVEEGKKVEDAELLRQPIAEMRGNLITYPWDQS